MRLQQLPTDIPALWTVCMSTSRLVLQIRNNRFKCNFFLIYAISFDYTRDNHTWLHFIKGIKLLTKAFAEIKGNNDLKKNNNYYYYYN